MNNRYNMHCVDVRKDTLLKQPAPLKLVASILLIDKDDKILISQRPASKSMAGLWEFPGGKIKENEAPETALIREVKEELGIDVSAGCLLPACFTSHRYEDFHLLMCIFSCRNWTGTIMSCENQQLKWVKANDIKQYKMPEANNIIINMLHYYI